MVETLSSYIFGKETKLNNFAYENKRSPYKKQKVKYMIGFT